MSHKTEIVSVTRPLAGLLAVTVRCCGDARTDSVLTIHQLHRSDEEILKDIEAHKARVEQLHAHDGRAEELMKTLGATIGDCGCPK